MVLLARHFATVLNERFGSKKQIGEAALQLLCRHNWPGNVRELLHVVEAALVLCEGLEVLPEHLPVALRNPKPTPSLAYQSTQEPLPTLQEAELIHIRRAIDISKGHRGNAAKLLGISERNLYRKLREHRLLS
jgi:DNA-binding NtrC family response regulator